MNKKVGLLFLTAFVFSAWVLKSCYPVSTGSAKWRITWNKKLMKGKKNFINEAEQTENNQKPNIIVIMADDLGVYDFSTYNTDSGVYTPNLNKLAKEGVLFNAGYATAPTCAPARAGFITGRVQNKFGFETQLMEFYPTNMVEYLSGKYLTNTGDFVLNSKPVYPREWQIDKQGVPPTEINMGEILQANGYTTGIVGKWHLGHSKNHTPENRGFDYQYGFNGAYSLFTPEKNWSGVVNYELNDFASHHQWSNGRYGDGAITENGKLIYEEKYLTFAIKDKSINFIKENKDKPFFLFSSFSAPHEPFQAPIDYYCRFSDEEDELQRVYKSMIVALDDAIGEMMDSLKALGLEDNTIIYFLSDNGGASYTGATENGPLKAGKLTQFEGGIRVPFIMKWKNKVPQGMVYDYPVSSTDIFTTSVLNSGGKLPTDRTYDGVDLIPFLNGTNSGKPHETLFWRADHIWALRDNNYKVILSVRDGWMELYNLETDISEEINIKEQMPDLWQHLVKKHMEWQKNELPKKPMWPRIMDHKFIIDGKEYLFPA